ncbi:hypothetical protein COO60DRAFT_1704786 [Scenedesmus sp. NREL 46B-D3]|nr:hypothetical protein COO60DRAFT_1704786 [Scenedesmus sp. NREL 46B-D3]
MKLAAILCLVLAANITYADDDVDVATYRGSKANTALDIIENEPSLSMLAGLIRENNLTAALDNKKRPVTVFAPTNQALTALANALPQDTPLAGPLVTNILLQHVTRS